VHILPSKWMIVMPICLSICLCTVCLSVWHLLKNSNCYAYLLYVYVCVCARAYLHTIMSMWRSDYSLQQFFFFFFCNLKKFFLIRYFLHLNFQCYPKSPPYPPSTSYPPTPTSWPWHSPVLRHIKFARPMGLSSQWWPTSPSSDTYAARDTSSGGTG
jgi:hypothetical protein